MNAPPSIAGFPQLSRPATQTLAESIYSSAVAATLANQWPGQRIDADTLQQLANEARFAEEIFSGGRRSTE